MKIKSKMRVVLKNRLYVFLLLVLFCVSCGSMPIDKSLLSCDVETYNKPLTANEDLFYAVKAGDLKTVKQTLNKSVNINVADRLGQSILMWAGWNGNYEIVEYLLNFDAAQRKKSYYPLKYKTESKEKYNPLFCLIMSNAMQTSNTLKAMDLLINNEHNLTGNYQLLEKEDSFNENILHKAVRSGYPEYLTFFIEQLEKIDPHKKLLKKLIDKKNTSSETPLVLAVKLQNEEMVKILIDSGADILKRDSSKKSLSVLALDEGRGNYLVYLSVMQAKLRYALEEEQTALEKKERKYLRIDSELGKSLDDADIVSGPFRMTYNRFKDTHILNPEQLEDDAYQDTKKHFFDLIFKARSNKDFTAIKTMIKENPYLVRLKYFDRDDTTEKNALQLSIEYDNEALFALIFDYVNRGQIPSVSGGYGDYLVYAILKNRPHIIAKLLEYNKNSKLPPNIMSPASTFNKAFSADRAAPTASPLIEFLRNDELRNNHDLLDSILIYYKPQYTNPIYAQDAYTEALRHNDEQLITILYECSNEKEAFYTVKAIYNRQQPVHFILLEKNFFTALTMFLQNSTFDYKYKYTDKNHKEYTFQDMLDERKNEPEVAKIIEYLKSVNLYKEKNTQ